MYRAEPHGGSRRRRSSMQLALLREKRFVDRRLGEIDARGYDHRAAHEAMHSPDLRRFILGWDQHGDHATAFGHHDALQLPTVDAVADIQALGLELGRADRLASGHSYSLTGHLK